MGGVNESEGERGGLADEEREGAADQGRSRPSFSACFSCASRSCASRLSAHAATVAKREGGEVERGEGRAGGGEARAPATRRRSQLESATIVRRLISSESAPSSHAALSRTVGTWKLDEASIEPVGGRGRAWEGVGGRGRAWKGVEGRGRAWKGVEARGGTWKLDEAATAPSPADGADGARAEADSSTTPGRSNATERCCERISGPAAAAPPSEVLPESAWRLSEIARDCSEVLPEVAAAAAAAWAGPGVALVASQKSPHSRCSVAASAKSGETAVRIDSHMSSCER